ncbi:hypothetical protein K8942_02005 [Candidatus Peribacteria bacterium]|nr:MAG: hypothetical protein K8942_02005 [Candidatus Peribacteria bacterium]
MKKLLVVLGFILVAGVAFYLGDQHGMREGPEAMEHDEINAQDHIMADGQEDIIQKYKCPSGMEFSANLTTEDSVSVWAEGTQPGVFGRVVSDNGRKYSNGSWEYFFRGESVTVSDVKSNTSETCTPVPQEGLAPVNVGD